VTRLQHDEQGASDLSAKRAQLLAYLAWLRGEQVSREKLLEDVFDPDFPDEEAPPKRLGEAFDSHRKFLGKDVREAITHLNTAALLMPTVNTAAFSLALAAFVQEQGAGPHKQILLVLEQAGWHKSGDLVVPEGLHLLFLPSHSSELQPAERLWPLSNEPLANRVFCSLDDLQDVQAARCRWLQAHPDVVRGRTSFHWWPSLGTT
jgi:hypothetical protein